MKFSFLKKLLLSVLSLSLLALIVVFIMLVSTYQTGSVFGFIKGVTASPIPDPDVRTVKFGMSQKDVMRLDSEAKLSEEGSKLVGYVSLGDYEATVYYVFNERDQLYLMYYEFNITHQITDKYFSDFSTIRAELKETYGDPSKDEIKWYNPLYRNDKTYWGTALQLGMMEAYAIFDNSTMTIKESLYCDDLFPMLKVAYQSKSYKK